MLKIPDLTDLDVAFGSCDWMPKSEAIPDMSGTVWDKIAGKWFFFGLPPETDFIPKEGVDAQKAARAVLCVLGSFSPKHEHKMAAVAFMLSEWFSEIKGWEAKTKAQEELEKRIGR